VRKCRVKGYRKSSLSPPLTRGTIHWVGKGIVDQEASIVPLVKGEAEEDFTWGVSLSQREIERVFILQPLRLSAGYSAV
jgi:hypothetical protein